MSRRLVRIRKILSEIVFILKKNPSLLNDREVREWIITVYGIAIVYGDSGIKNPSRTTDSKLFQQSYH